MTALPDHAMALPAQPDVSAPGGGAFVASRENARVLVLRDAVGRSGGQVVGAWHGSLVPIGLSEGRAL